MARFFVRLACFLGIQLPILAFVVSYGSPGRGVHYLSAIIDKAALLANETRPRLIVVGGSNVAFGIDSDLFAQSSDFQPINVGLHAGLGLDFPLNLVERFVRAGDCIVVMPEYKLLATPAFDGSPDTIGLLSEQWPPAREFYEPERRTGLKSFLDCDGLWLAHLWIQRARHRLRGGTVEDGVYARSSFNAYGDMIGHHGLPPQEFKLRPVLNYLDEASLRRAIERLNLFHRACLAKGATVWFAYPAIPRECYQASRVWIDKLDTTLRESLEIPLTEQPADTVFARDLFFDTYYHLTKEGAARRSGLLLGHLQSELRIAHQPSDKPDRRTQ